MERIERYCEENSDRYLDFASPDMQQYFDALACMECCSFDFLKDVLSEKQLQQFSFLVSGKYIVNVPNIEDISMDCEEYTDVNNISHTPLQEIQYMEAMQSQFRENLNIYIKNIDDSSIFLSIYTQYSQYISFANISPLLKTHTSIIQAFTQFNEGITENSTFSFLDVPQEFFRQFQSPQEIENCFMLAHNPEQVDEIFTQLHICRVLNSENSHILCTLPSLQNEIYTDIRNRFHHILISQDRETLAKL